MLEFGFAAALVCAGVAGGVAYGYRGQRDSAAEQVTYLRKQIAALMPGEPPPAGARALTTVGGGPR